MVNGVKSQDVSSANNSYLYTGPVVSGKTDNLDDILNYIYLDSKGSLFL